MEKGVVIHKCRILGEEKLLIRVSWKQVERRVWGDSVKWCS
ncbi:hypothetical protein CCACVL1_25359 [Corchorus capsularis]|uniref:Uncharacterized protein n=1 Tax=Corchorus capsularis TaxID=210143 RepID=A0A1R3GL33_COCAP|nr:hypothetical protein CCACVL1_25359 [Corchorus capsularis]